MTHILQSNNNWISRLTRFLRDLVQDTSIYPTSTTRVSGGTPDGAPNITASNVAGTEKALDPTSWRAFKVTEKSPVTSNTYRLRWVNRMGHLQICKTDIKEVC